MIDTDRTITWAELDQRVRQTAAHLRAIGVEPGERIGLRLKDHADHVVAMLGVAATGASFVPLDWRAKPDEIARLTTAFGVAGSAATTCRPPTSG